AKSSAEIDKDAIAALDKMGTYLHSLKAFQVRAVASREDVLDDGQKIELDSSTDMLVERPDRFRIEFTSDRQQRLYLYNGKELSVWAERANYYATVPAPSTIAQVVDELQNKFDVDMPLVDLFDWGSERSKVNDIRSATSLGPSVVSGTTCEQFAFRQEGLDWQ